MQRRFLGAAGMLALVVSAAGCGGEEAAAPTTTVPATTTTAAPTTTTTTLPPTTTTLVYEIQPGDTLTRIANRFGLTRAELAEANGITDPDRIEAGDTLVIPPPTTTTLAPVTTTTTTLNPGTTVPAQEVGEATSTTGG